MTPLVQITIPSIYKVNGVAVPLPKRMSQCTPDTKAALLKTASDLKMKGGRLVLSDLFRSYDMQLASYMDYVAKRKTAFSPPPGGSLHEAGRAFDLDLGALKISLKDFWAVAASNGLSPIISEPNSKTSEAWHFSCRGSHGLIYDYYKAGKGNNFEKPYQAMAASAIVGVGVQVDKFGDGQVQAYVQSALVRLGFELGNIDGRFGPKTNEVLAQLGLSNLSPIDLKTSIDARLQERFPQEFFDQSTDAAPFA